MSVGSTTTSSASPIVQFTGLSGFDSSSIVNALVQFASEPITLLQNQVTLDQAKVAAWTDVGTQLSGLAAAVTNLTSSSNMTGMTATSSATGVATATATASATAGSYKLVVSQLATSTTVQSSAQLAAPASTGTYVSALAVPVTYGTFTINGVQINLSGGTAGQTDTTDTLGQVISDINTALGYTAATLNNNQITLTSSNGQPFQIGSSSDTSNFLTAANLTGAAQVLSGGQYSATSTSPITKVNPSAPLSSAGFATTPSGGQFMINGVTISYSAGDSLNTVISDINSSGAGVSAYYDSTSDTVDLTATSTGTQAISLKEVGGDNLLAALNLSGATQNYGLNAQFTINGGSQINSASNQVSTAIPNVTINLAATGTTTLTVAADTQTAENTINAFVTAYNTANADINGYLAQGKALQGDGDLQNIQQSLFNTAFAPVSGQPAGYGSLAQIGITTDKDTGNLVVNTNSNYGPTLQEALAANPQAVYNLFSNATNGLANTLSNLINGSAGRPGYLTPVSSKPGSGGQIATEEQAYNNDITDLNQQISDMQQSVQLYQQQLQQEFSAMETTLSGLQSTSGYLSAFVSSLNSSSSSSTSSSSTSSSTSTGG